MVQRRDPLLRQIGARIRLLREAKQMSQEELAAAAGIDRSYMSGIERGVRNPAILRLVQIARALGAHLSDLTETVGRRTPSLKKGLDFVFDRWPHREGNAIRTHPE